MARIICVLLVTAALVSCNERPVRVYVGTGCPTADGIAVADSIGALHGCKEVNLHEM